MEFVRIVSISIAVAVGLTGCSGNGNIKAESLAAKGDWLKAVMEYRSELERKPGSVELKSSLRQTELRAAEYYFQLGLSELAKNNYDAAIGHFEEGLAAMPGHEKLQASLNTAIAKREAYELLKEARRYKEIGAQEKERIALERALELAPGDARILGQWRDLNERVQRSRKDEFELKTRENISLNFQDADIKTAFNFLSDTFGINVIFDESVKDKKITLFANDISFRQALNLMMATTQTFYKKVANNTILLAPDTKDKRGQYEDYVIRTFHLTNTSAKPLADMLKGILSLQKVVVNEEVNTLTIRDTEDGLGLAAKIIQANDRKPAEIILEVDILEVDKQKSQQLGFDYGSTVTLKYPEYNVSNSFASTLAAGTVTLPAISFRYFKQNVDAKTLANPKIRVIDGKQAKIHIGDRVPLRSSTIQDATGQTRTTFQYTDIGIRLIVEPEIQLDNSSLVKLGLEVSSLGQNLGTQAEPAFSIGTRNAETYMLLRDGETAILGGLIRDEERRTKVKVPGLGDVPVIGPFFSSFDDSDLQTDVLLTITPRIIRPWQLPPKDTWSLYSGKAERYFSQPFISDVDFSRGDTSIAGQLGNTETRALPAETVLSFENPAYRINQGEEIEVNLIKSALSPATSFPVRIRYDESLMQFVSLESIHEKGITQVEKVVDGEVSAVVSIGNDGIADGGLAFAKARFLTREKGVSYIIMGTKSAAGTAGDRYQIEPGSAYVVIE
jgi:general secretion pathway protein D